MQSPGKEIPFYRPAIDREEIDEVVDTLKSGWLTTGRKARQFAENFAAYLGHKHAVPVNSCTAALHLALEAVGVREGDTVVVPTMTFAATAEVVRYLHAKPLLVDCRECDFNLDVDDAEQRIRKALADGERVTAIIPMHYGGQIGDVAGVRRLAEKYALKAVEDAAHCCPGFYRLNGRDPWQKVGHSADVSCYSFYANKCITTGEGGMACTHDAGYAERMQIMSLRGISKDAWKRYTNHGSWYYEIIAPGYKYNMTDLAAAIGIHQLNRANQFLDRRTEIAQLYHQLLDDTEELRLPRLMPNRIHSWHLYCIRLLRGKLWLNRDAFIEELKKRHIGVSVHWIPLHMHPYYVQTYGYKPDNFPVAASLSREVISLPIFPAMRDEEVVYVCNAVKEIIRSALPLRVDRSRMSRSVKVSHAHA